jgi:hypothetical protein
MIVEEISKVLNGEENVSLEENLRNELDKKVVGKRSVIEIEREMKKIKDVIKI